MSLIRKRVSKLSVPSTIKSIRSTSFLMLVWSIFAITGSMLIDELILRNLRAAASALGRLSCTSCSSYNACLCKLSVSIKSRSTRRIKPMPDRVKMFERTLPNAPQPQIKMRLEASFSCPCTPISENMNCFRYLSSCLL